MIRQAEVVSPITLTPGDEVLAKSKNVKIMELSARKWRFGKNEAKPELLIEVGQAAKAEQTQILFKFLGKRIEVNSKDSLETQIKDKLGIKDSEFKRVNNAFRIEMLNCLRQMVVWSVSDGQRLLSVQGKYVVDFHVDDTTRAISVSVTFMSIIIKFGDFSFTPVEGSLTAFYEMEIGGGACYFVMQSLIASNSIVARLCYSSVLTNDDPLYKLVDKAEIASHGLALTSRWPLDQKRLSLEFGCEEEDKRRQKEEKSKKKESRIDAQIWQSSQWRRTVIVIGLINETLKDTYLSGEAEPSEKRVIYQSLLTVVATLSLPRSHKAYQSLQKLSDSVQREYDIFSKSDPQRKSSLSDSCSSSESQGTPKFSESPPLSSSPSIDDLAAESALR